MFKISKGRAWSYGRFALGMGCGFSLLIATSAFAQGQCADPLTIEGGFGKASFDIQIADDPAERSQGLMFVESLPRFSGMLFIYEAPQSAAFWMRNTLIPLDMIFAGSDGVVTHIHSDAVPLDETPIPGGDDVKYVLEINGGLAKKLGISGGDVLLHASLLGDVTCP